MVNISYNQKKYKLDVFQMDTPQTLTNRIAWAFGSLPDGMEIVNKHLLDQSLDELRRSKETIIVTKIANVPGVELTEFKIQQQKIQKVLAGFNKIESTLLTNFTSDSNTLILTFNAGTKNSLYSICSSKL